MKTFINNPVNLFMVFILTASFLFSHPAVSQSIVVEPARSEILVLRLGEYAGAVQWQVSPDGEDWSDVPYGTADTLEVSASNRLYYRGSVTVTGCPEFFTDTVQILADASHPLKKTIRMGETELLYPADELPIRYDGSLSTIQKDENTMLFFHSWGCRGRSSAHTWHYGPPDDPLRHLKMNKSEEEFWDYNGYYQNKEQQGVWILGMYKRDNGDLLAITHSEVRDFPGGMENQWFALGLGYSTDGGKSFTFCGEIVTPANKYHNVGGGPYILIDDYIYVYFNDRAEDGKRQICVARAPLTEVLEAAEKHQVTEWVKYRDGKWDVPGLNSGISGSSVIPIVYGGEDVHSDAAYCTALGKYLLTVQTHGANRLLLFSSEDGLNWEREADIDHAPGYLQAYSSFVDYNGPTADCREVDGEFYIYWPRRLLGEVHNNTMFRRKITIELDIY